MALKVPVTLIGEYRGVQPGGEFIDKSTGQVVEYGAKLKFEVEDEQGDVSLVPIRQDALDKLTPPFDSSTLKRGDRVTISALFVLGADGERSYMMPTGIVPEVAKLAKVG